MINAPKSGLFPSVIGSTLLHVALVSLIPAYKAVVSSGDPSSFFHLPSLLGGDVLQRGHSTPTAARLQAQPPTISRSSDASRSQIQDASPYPDASSLLSDAAVDVFSSDASLDTSDSTSDATLDSATVDSSRNNALDSGQRILTIRDAQIAVNDASQRLPTTASNPAGMRTMAIIWDGAVHETDAAVDGVATDDVSGSNREGDAGNVVATDAALVAADASDVSLADASDDSSIPLSHPVSPTQAPRTSILDEQEESVPVLQMPLPINHQPIRHLTYEGLLAAAQLTVIYPHARNVDPGFFYLESEGHDYHIPLADLTRVEEGFKDLVIELAQMIRASTHESPEDQLQRLVNVLFVDGRIRKYIREEARLFSVLNGDGGNCEAAQAKFIIAAVIASGIELPSHLHLGVQHFGQDHIQAVIYDDGSQSADHRPTVRVLASGQIQTNPRTHQPEIRAPVFEPAYLNLGWLSAQPGQSEFVSRYNTDRLIIAQATSTDNTRPKHWDTETNSRLNLPSNPYLFGDVDHPPPERDTLGMPDFSNDSTTPGGREEARRNWENSDRWRGVSGEITLERDYDRWFFRDYDQDRLYRSLLVRVANAHGGNSLVETPQAQALRMPIAQETFRRLLLRPEVQEFRRIMRDPTQLSLEFMRFPLTNHDIIRRFLSVGRSINPQPSEYTEIRNAIRAYENWGHEHPDLFLEQLSQNLTLDNIATFESNISLLGRDARHRNLLQRDPAWIETIMNDYDLGGAIRPPERQLAQPARRVLAYRTAVHHQDQEPTPLPAPQAPLPTPPVPSLLSSDAGSESWRSSPIEVEILPPTQTTRSLSMPPHPPEPRPERTRVAYYRYIPAQPEVLRRGILTPLVYTLMTHESQITTVDRNRLRAFLQGAHPVAMGAFQQRVDHLYQRAVSENRIITWGENWQLYTFLRQAADLELMRYSLETGAVLPADPQAQNSMTFPVGFTSASNSSWAGIYARYQGVGGGVMGGDTISLSQEFINLQERLILLARHIQQIPQNVPNGSVPIQINLFLPILTH